MEKFEFLSRITYYELTDLADFLHITSICRKNVRSDFFMEKYKLKHPYGPHRWVDRRWLRELRVWVERCSLCGAIRFWRVNDTVHITPEGIIHVLINEEIIEFSEKAFIKKVLKDAGEKYSAPYTRRI